MRVMFDPQMVADYAKRPTPSNYPERDELSSALLRLASRHCGYLGTRGCDCKYGCAGGPEQTGCPELAAAAALVAVLTPREFALLIKRVMRRRNSNRLRDAKPAKKKARARKR